MSTKNKDDKFELPEIKEYYIAYLDLLGYVDIISSNKISEIEFNKIIHGAFVGSRINIDELNLTFKSMSGIDAAPQIYMKAFSDNIILCLEVVNSNPLHLITFLEAVKQLQIHFLENNLLVKGAVIKDKVAIAKEYVFGSGLVKAYKRESGELCPRVTIDKEVLDSIANISSMVKNDDDMLADILEKLRPSELGNSLHEYCEKINSTYPVLCGILNSLYSKTNDDKFLNKRVYLEECYKNALDEMGEDPEVLVDIHGKFIQIFADIFEDANKLITNRYNNLLKFVNSNLKSMLVIDGTDEQYYIDPIHNLTLYDLFDNGYEDAIASFKAQNINNPQYDIPLMTDADVRDRMVEYRLTMQRGISVDLSNKVFNLINGIGTISREKLSKVASLHAKSTWLLNKHNNDCERFKMKKLKIKSKLLDKILQANQPEIGMDINLKYHDFVK